MRAEVFRHLRRVSVGLRMIFVGDNALVGDLWFFVAVSESLLAVALHPGSAWSGGVANCPSAGVGLSREAPCCCMPVGCSIARFRWVLLVPEVVSD